MYGGVIRPALAGIVAHRTKAIQKRNIWPEAPLLPPDCPLAGMANTDFRNIGCLYDLWMHSGSPGVIGVRMRWYCASTQSENFLLAKVRPGTPAPATGAGTLQRLHGVNY
jgi:hypothetical protein